jgi:hypothetical protein
VVRRYAAAVNVRAWLSGHPFDLQTLAELFASGDTRVVKEGEDYALTSTEIDNRPDGVPCYEVAAAVLRRVNGLARVLRSDDYRPVGLTGRYQEGDGNHTVVSADVAEARARAYPVTVVVGSATLEARAHVSAVGEVTRDGAPTSQPAPPGPSDLALVASHPHLAEVLDLMGADTKALNWVALYKVYEIIREDVRQDKIETRGWASGTEISAFTASANRSDVSGAGARHARQPGGPPKRTMTMDEGRQFITSLATRWMNALQP